MVLGRQKTHGFRSPAVKCLTQLVVLTKVQDVHLSTNMHTRLPLPDMFQASLSSTGYIVTYGVKERLEEDWCVCSCPEFYVENAVQSAEPKYLFENT